MRRGRRGAKKVEDDFEIDEEIIKNEDQEEYEQPNNKSKKRVAKKFPSPVKKQKKEEPTEHDLISAKEYLCGPPKWIFLHEESSNLHNREVLEKISSDEKEKLLLEAKEIVLDRDGKLLFQTDETTKKKNFRLSKKRTEVYFVTSFLTNIKMLS